MFGWLVLLALARQERTTSARRAAAFLLGVSPAAVITVLLNLRWFGRPLASGYGTTSELLHSDRVVTNVSRYGGWLVDTSPLLLVGVVAILLPLSVLWARPVWRLPMLFASIVASTLSVYLVYQPFNDWWYLRFLLPAWPVLAVATALALGVVGNLGRIARACCMALLIVAGFAGVRLAWSRGVFALGEERYATIAALVASATEPRAVVFTMSHSGTVRYYAGRETLRFDLLDPQWLDGAVDWLAARGRKPYVLVEDWELPEFRSRFGPHSTLGQLPFPPAVSWESTRVAGRVYLFDPIDGERFATADPGPAFERNQPRSSPSRFPKLAFEP